MPRRNRKKNIKSGEFTNSVDLQNRFFAETEERRQKGDKKDGDAGYWNGGRCEWGGSHNLQEDCEALAKFFNDTNSIENDVNDIKLAANESIFNQKKQTLISKIKSLNSKCNVTESYSIANICCIWNDYFGSFLQPFLRTFASKLSRQLNDIEKLEPKHQKELLQLEKEAQELQSIYDENVKKANDPNTSPADKAKFLLLANEAATKTKNLKAKIKANPLADLSRFSNLDDLETLIGGNVPKNPPSSKNSKTSGSGGGSGGTTSTPNLFEDPQSFLEKNQSLIFVAIGLIVVLFLFYSQNQKSEDEDEKEEKRFMRQMMMMRMINSNSPPSNKIIDPNPNE